MAGLAIVSMFLTAGSSYADWGSLRRVRHATQRDAAVIEGQGLLLCSREADRAVRFDGDSAPFAAAALEILAGGATREELREALARRAGADVDGALVDGLLQAFERARVVSTAAAPAQARRLEGVRVVLGVTGAIACADAPRVVMALQARGATVRVVMSAVSKRFVSRAVLEALTHHPVACGWRAEPNDPVPHIQLARWADAVLVAPASATTLARIAHGECSDVVAALAIATTAPVVVAPSMNDRMLAAPATRRNLAMLIDDGVYLVRSAAGVEVADRPGDRDRHFGGTLAPTTLAQAFESWFLHVAATRPGLERRTDWDALYSSTQELPWASEGLGDSLRKVVLERAPPPRRALDIGCGLGAQARELAGLGYRVVATDISAAAIARASAEDEHGDVVFVRDDVTSSGLRGRFDLLLDRGTFHGLPPSRQPLYAESIARLAAPGATLVLLHDGPEADARFSTARFDASELAGKLSCFELVDHFPTTLRSGEEGAGVCSVLVRRPDLS